MIEHVGFSGTQNGMSLAQWHAVEKLLKDAEPVYAHHGDCIGADENFNTIARELEIWTWGHPPLNSSKRAYCHVDVQNDPEEYLDRNKTIVNASNWLIFTPEGPEKLRSGTWSTVRYARSLGKLGFIVWPNGEIEDL